MAEYIDRESIYKTLSMENPFGWNNDDLGELFRQAKPADVAPVRHGRWEWFEEWSPGTTEYPTECDDCGWRCSNCKTALEDVVGGYWDDPYDEPKLKFCPNCGAKMDLEDAEKYDMEMSL